jgi:hypothetical protein
MLDLDLRASKLEKERQQRLNKLKQEKLAEQKRKQEYEKKQQELQELARLQREREEALRLQQEEEEAEWMELSGGIKFFHEFRQFYLLGKKKSEENGKQLHDGLSYTNTNE